MVGELLVLDLCQINIFCRKRSGRKEHIGVAIKLAPGSMLGQGALGAFVVDVVFMVISVIVFDYTAVVVTGFLISIDICGFYFTG